MQAPGRWDSQTQAPRMRASQTQAPGMWDSQTQAPGMRAPGRWRPLHDPDVSQDRPI